MVSSLCVFLSSIHPRPGFQRGLQSGACCQWPKDQERGSPAKTQWGATTPALYPRPMQAIQSVDNSGNSSQTVLLNQDTSRQSDLNTVMRAVKPHVSLPSLLSSIRRPKPSGFHSSPPHKDHQVRASSWGIARWHGPEPQQHQNRIARPLKTKLSLQPKPQSRPELTGYTETEWQSAKKRRFYKRFK